MCCSVVYVKDKCLGPVAPCRCLSLRILGKLFALQSQFYDKFKRSQCEILQVFFSCYNIGRDGLFKSTFLS